MLLKNELQHLISGIGKYAEANLIQTVACYLRQCKKASGNDKAEKFEYKEQETKSLLDFCKSKNILESKLNDAEYLAEGAEQKVYLLKDGLNVVKTNDSVFYASWEDYFTSLLLHNYFFPSTQYELLGFILDKEILHAVVKQPYIIITEETDIESVKNIMLSNGFVIIKNNDYNNENLGIILEDLHEENVVSNNGVLFFIDTVFYLDTCFYS